MVSFGKLCANVVEETCGQTYGDLEGVKGQAYAPWDGSSPIYPEGFDKYSLHRCNNDSSVLILTSRRDMKPYSTIYWWRVNRLAPGVSVKNYDGGIAYTTSNFYVRPETYTASNGAKVWYGGLCPCGDQGMTLVSLQGGVNPPTVPRPSPPSTPRPTKPPVVYAPSSVRQHDYAAAASGAYLW